MKNNKREKIENNEKNNGLLKTVINWLITIYLNPLTNPYK